MRWGSSSPRAHQLGESPSLQGAELPALPARLVCPRSRMVPVPVFGGAGAALQQPRGLVGEAQARPKWQAEV